MTSSRTAMTHWKVDQVGRMKWVEVGPMQRNVSMRDHISNSSGLWMAHKPSTGNHKSVQHLEKSCLVSTPAPEHIFQFRGQRCVLWHRSIPERLSPFSTGGSQLFPSGQKNGRKIRMYPKNCLISKASHGFCSKFPCLCFTLRCYLLRVMEFPSSILSATLDLLWESLLCFSPHPHVISTTAVVGLEGWSKL